MASLFLFFGGGFRNMSPATAVLFRFPQPARANQSGLCLEHHPSPSHNQLRHGDPFHRCLSGILAWQRGLLSALWHGNPSHRHLRGIPACRTASRPVHDRQLTDALICFRHGDPFHRYLSGITAWRRWLVDGHRHDDLAHKPLRGILAWRRGYLSGLWPVFGTATHPTGTSEAFPRGETVISPTSLRLVIFTEHANMPYTHLERLSACSVFCLKGPSATDTGNRHRLPPPRTAP